MNSPQNNEQTDALAERLTTLLQSNLGRSGLVARMSRLTGGSSNETWAFDFVTSEESMPLIFRRNFSHSALDLQIDSEFKLLKSLHRLGFPVPLPLMCVVNDSPLDTPFMIVRRERGTDARKFLAKHPNFKEGRALGMNLVSVLARLHSLDWNKELGDVLDEPRGNIALSEVDRWAPEIESSNNSRPLLVASLAWLRTNAPPNNRICLLHGDFKANNVLVTEDGVEAVLDWELAHIGDPYEDIAWTLLWDTQFDLINGMISERRFLEFYENSCGIPLDHARLIYWKVFSLFKLAAIFMRGTKRPEHTDTPPLRPMLLQLARAVPYLESRIADLLFGLLSKGGER